MLKSSEKEKILTERREKQRKGERQTKITEAETGQKLQSNKDFCVDESRMQHNEVFSVAAVVVVAAAAAAADVAD